MELSSRLGSTFCIIISHLMLLSRARGHYFINMANERITEDLVRSHFKEDALFSSIKWEEQKSTLNRVQELLKGESKGHGRGNGYPEFILSFPTNTGYIIVVECKAKVSDHESENRDKAVKFAVDGALHYAKALSKEYNVIAIAASGQNETELKISHFYWKKGASDYSELTDTKLLAIDDYMQVFDDQFFISDFITRDIASKAQYLNEDFHNLSIPEHKRCTMISAILLALINDEFKDSFEEEKSTNSLGQSILSAINTVFEDEEDLVRNKAVLLKEFESILNEPIFVQKKIKNKKSKKVEDSLTVLKECIIYLKKNVYPLIRHANIGFDVLGRFYIEFIRYAASEQKLGLVLTPAHITELFCDLGELTTKDIVYDPCCGTGGFLVAAMQRMFKLAGNNKKLRKHIRTKQICGCEIRSEIYTYACSSMRFRGDGKSSIYNGNCFNHTKSIADNHKPTIAFLNPPYDVGTAGQLEFIEHSLSVLDKKANGRVVAIVQMSCATKNETELKVIKNRILSNHHLKAVISMPDDLFYPVGVVTCIMIFEANKPNKGRKTWFGYFKDDGYIKRKHIGRLDAKNRYTPLKDRLLKAYMNLDEIAGLSVRKEVTAKDEWCAEAYLETDYSILSHDAFDQKVLDYCVYKMRSRAFSINFNIDLAPLCPNNLSIDTSNWKLFTFGEIFNIKKGFYNKKPDEDINGSIPFIGATDSNNGVTQYCDYETIEQTSKTGDENNAPINEKIFSGCHITVSNNGSIGYAFYQDREFTCTHDVNPLTLKKYPLNKYIALFICTVIEVERYRWTYGRKWRPSRMPKSTIKLPVKKDGTPDWDFMENFIKSRPYSKLV